MKERIFLHPGMGEGEPHYLDRVGTLSDIARLGLTLNEGMKITFCDYDGSEKLADDKLLFEGTVHYDQMKQKWYAMLDWRSFRHESDEMVGGFGFAFRPVLPAKNGITSGQLQIILNAAKKDAGSCASAFSAGMIPYRLKFSLKAFDAQIQNAKYLQYPNPATSPLGPLSSVEAQALKGSIALYPNFFTDTSARQAGIVVHENLHTYTGWNDANVFYAFQQRGITPNEIKLFTSYGNTDGITTWILRGCK